MHPYNHSTRYTDFKHYDMPDLCVFYLLTKMLLCINIDIYIRNCVEKTCSETGLLTLSLRRMFIGGLVWLRRLSSILLRVFVVSVICLKVEDSLSDMCRFNPSPSPPEKWPGGGADGHYFVVVLMRRIDALYSAFRNLFFDWYRNGVTSPTFLFVFLVFPYFARCSVTYTYCFR